MEEFLNYLALYRVCAIFGRMGFGKTAFAFYLAKTMLDRGLVDGVISNCPTVLPAHYSGIDDGTLYNRAVVYDEAWSELDSRTSMTNNTAYGAYARKMNVYWLFPTVHPIDKRLRALELKPFYRNPFTNKSVWKYYVNGNPEPLGTVGFNATAGYNLYATQHIPNDDCGILDRFTVTYYEQTGELLKSRSKRLSLEAALRMGGDE